MQPRSIQETDLFTHVRWGGGGMGGGIYIENIVDSTPAVLALGLLY